MSKIVERICAQGSYKKAIADPTSNWDIYINDKGNAISMSKIDSDGSTFYGDVAHIHRLISRGQFTDFEHITEYGLQALSGIFSTLTHDLKQGHMRNAENAIIK